MVKIIGYEFKSGTFEDKGKSISYDNINIHYVTDSNPSVYGFEAGMLKVKRTDFPKICQHDITELKDKQVTLEYIPVNGRAVLSKITVLK